MSQTDQFLKTKLYIPPVRPEVVARPRLNERLRAGLGRKLILVSAPAGYGKTTLVSAWVKEQERPAAWVSLDEGDNDLARFLIYFVAALQTLSPDIGAGALGMLQSPQTPPTETVLMILINEIAVRMEDFTLVLDDYHLIENQDIDEAVTFLLEHMPPQMMMVIASRIDPSMPLSRLRAGGQMTEIRSDDLRFSLDEITAFLNEGMGLDLSVDDVAALGERTEGWIASLQLAALSLQGRQDKHEFVEAFSGSHHYIIDYLVDEVMSRLEEETQRFLRRTSILDRFNASLCDEVFGISNSKGIIAELEETNLFLVPLDDKRLWYRYHHLFADFLNQRLREREPGSIPQLHSLASRWFEKQNFFIEAVNHALDGEDYEFAAQVIEDIGPDMMMRSEFDQLARWMDAMPQELVESWPWLCIIQAWMHDRWAKLDTGEQYLQHAEAALESGAASPSEEAEKIIRGQISALRALFTLKTGKIPQSIEHSKQALAYLPEDYFNRGVANYSLGWAKLAQGDLSGAIQAFDEGRRASLAAGNRILAQVIIMDIGKTQALQGKLHQAAETLDEAIQFKYEKSEVKIPYASSASVSLGDILREWDDLDAAMSRLQESIEISAASKVVDALTQGYASMALVNLAQGDLEAAIQACKKAERMVKDIPDLETETKHKTLDSRVKLLLAQNKLAEAARLVKERGLKADAEINYFISFEHILLARVLFHLGRETPESQELSDAETLLANILEATRPVGYVSHVIEALTLQALAFEVSESLIKWPWH